jgi:hypothetical protein
MRISDRLNPEYVLLLKNTFKDNKRVFINKIRGQYDFNIPTRDSGRRVLGGLPPSDLSVSSFSHCVDHASVYGVKGGTSKMVRFEKPKPRKTLSA